MTLMELLDQVEQRRNKNKQLFYDKYVAIRYGETDEDRLFRMNNQKHDTCQKHPSKTEFVCSVCEEIDEQLVTNSVYSNAVERLKEEKSHLLILKDQGLALEKEMIKLNLL